jgi:hypothetical protein
MHQASMALLGISVSAHVAKTPRLADAACTDDKDIARPYANDALTI